MSMAAPLTPSPSRGRGAPVKSWSGAPDAAPESMHTLSPASARLVGLTQFGLCEMFPEAMVTPELFVPLFHRLEYATFSKPDWRKRPYEVLLVTMLLKTVTTSVDVVST